MIKATDKGASKLLKAIQEGLPSVDVGVLQGSESSRKYGDGGPATVLDIANYQELGTKTIPPRPFISGWFDKHSHELIPQIKALAAKVAKGELTPEEYLRKLGNLAVGGIQKYMASGVPPALSQATIDRKGSSKPLIDTGLLRSSITFRESKG